MCICLLNNDAFRNLLRKKILLLGILLSLIIFYLFIGESKKWKIQKYSLCIIFIYVNGRMTQINFRLGGTGRKGEKRQSGFHTDRNCTDILVLSSYC